MDRNICDIFLGGTCNGSKWRDTFIKLNNYKCFNPVVKNWTEECYENEKWHMENDHILFYVITPKQHGFLSFAEVVDLAYKYKDKLYFTYMIYDEGEEFDDQLKSLNKIGLLVREAGGNFYQFYESACDAVSEKLETMFL